MLTGKCTSSGLPCFGPHTHLQLLQLHLERRCLLAGALQR